MKLSEKITAELEGLKKISGYMCTNVVNYRQAVPAANEGSDPEDPANFQARQCSAIIKAVTDSLTNLRGGRPREIIINAENMTMVMRIVDHTYFCGVGLSPGGDVENARAELEKIGRVFLAEVMS